MEELRAFLLNKQRGEKHDPGEVGRRKGQAGLLGVEER